MQQKLFALSLGFGGLILAAHHAFASPLTHPAAPGRAQAGTPAEAAATDTGI